MNTFIPCRRRRSSSPDSKRWSRHILLSSLRSCSIKRRPLKSCGWLVALLYTGLCCQICAASAPDTERYENAQKAVRSSNYEKAEEELKLALQANPLNAKAHYLLGTLLAARGAEDLAMIGFQRTIVIDPTHPEALHNLGTLLLRRGQAVDAVGLLETAVSYKPDYIPAQNSLAKAYFAAGLPELAIATYQEVLSREPDNVIATENLEMLLAAAKMKPAPEATGKVDEKAKTGASTPGSKPEAGKPDPKSPAKPPDANAKKAAPLPSPETFRELLNELPFLEVEQHDDALAVTGWTRGSRERAILDRVLAKWPDVLDLTGVDAGDPQRMLGVDVALFIVIGIDTESVGFNFLRQVTISSTVFGKQGPGDVLQGAEGGSLTLPAWGALSIASIDYDVNIANAVQEQVAVLARPHLTTLSGTPASFLAGGEFVFKVSGLENGDIKPYPFGTSVKVTPTLLRTPGEDGEPRIHLNVSAQRTSVLEFLTAQGDEEGSIVFDKLTVDSQAILAIDETLILSGLNQREARDSRTGVPFLKSVPVIKYLFSQKTRVETDTAILILLTPRDPVFNDQNTRNKLDQFVTMRRDFMTAQQGSAEELEAFKVRYPNWQDIPPNWYASHFFLLETSDLYRRVTSEDLVDEGLDLHLLHAPKKLKL